ncbi:unnamed protein product [Lota lota]
MHTRHFTSSLGCMKGADVEEGQDIHRFVDLVKRMLQLEAAGRAGSSLHHHPCCCCHYCCHYCCCTSAPARTSQAGETWPHVRASIPALAPRGALLKSLVSQQPLKSIKRKRVEDDSSGNRFVRSLQCQLSGLL